MQSHFSCVRLFVTQWTIVHQAPLSMGFSRQGYWSGLGCHFLLQGIFLTQRLNSCLSISPALVGVFFTTNATWERREVLGFQQKQKT